MQMAFHLPISFSNGSPQKMATLKPEKEAARRTGNYKPSICDDDFIQSLRSDYEEERFRKRADELKEYVRNNLLVERSNEEDESCIELIDTLQRLGLGYLFEDEIRTVLVNILKFHSAKQYNLHYTSLIFRILRQHGFFIPQDEFTPFMENEIFKEALGDDTRAMLSLYDASHLSLEGETLLDNAREFARRHLRQALTKRNLNSELSKLVERGLELPYYWRLPRIEARWWIDIYESNKEKNAELLELAKLDYNICQASLQNDLKAMSRWWTEKSLAKLLPFSRDRIPESFLFGLGFVSDPKYSHATQWITLAFQFLSTVDDMYDIYGTLEELELFTNAVERWDVNALDDLPMYMKPCYLALLNFNHEIGYTTLKLQGQNSIPTMKKIWIDLCNSYLVEARWFDKGYTPTLDEYVSNAWISAGGPLVLITAYLQMNLEITEETLHLLNNCQDVIYPACVAARLQDDLGTSNKELERGDVAKAVECYMHEKGVSEYAARKHIEHMINESWKKMNRYLVLGSSFPRTFVEVSMDALRITQWFYSDGDGFGFQRVKTFEQFKRLVVEPISIYVAVNGNIKHC